MRESQLDELCGLQQTAIFEPYSKSESKTQRSYLLQEQMACKLSTMLFTVSWNIILHDLWN